MTIDEKIHVFENSRLVSYNFTSDAVTSAYVEALSALRAQQEAEKNEPLTPCDVCRYSPPSSFDGKPCTMCPAERRIV